MQEIYEKFEIEGVTAAVGESIGVFFILGHGTLLAMNDARAAIKYNDFLL